MKYDVHAFDEGRYFLPSDEVGFDKLAIRVDILFFPAEEVVRAYHLVSGFDELVDQPGAHEPRSTRHQHSLGFQTFPPFSGPDLRIHIGTSSCIKKCSPCMLSVLEASVRTT